MSWIKERFIYNSLEPEKFINQLCFVAKLSRIDVSKVMHRFRSIIGLYNCYLLKLFDEYRYIFVTEAKINLPAMEKCYEKRAASYQVEGALFDLKNLEFIRFPNVSKSKNDVFYKFVIYDAGIPHIVWNDDEKKYSIMYIFSGNDFEYQFIKTREVPITITHLNYEYFDDDTCLRRTRAVFYKKGEKTGCLVLDGLVLVKKINNVTYHGCVISNLLQDEINNSFFMENLKKSGRDEFVDEESFFVHSIDMENHIIGGDSFVVTKDVSGKYGDKVFLLLNNPISYKKSYSCFEYESCNDYDGKFKGHLIVGCSLAINDFDNENVLYDATARRIISKIK